MNIRRLILAALVAGVPCNRSGMALGTLVLAEDARRLLESMETPPSGMRMFIEHVAMRFGTGLLAVWLYVAIRPRFGKGPRTAIIAGVFLWIAVYLFAGLLLEEIQVYSARTTIIALAWGLVEAIVITMAGGALYRESSSGDS